MARILLYQGSMCCETLVRDNLQRIGYDVDVISGQVVDYNSDDNIKGAFLEYFTTCINAGMVCSAVFTIDYYPVISDICEMMNIPYVSWIVDCPMLTLYSKTITNNCNRVFLFDEQQYISLKEMGVSNCYHMPLATDVLGWDNISVSDNDITRYQSDVSFLGNLYNDSKTNPYKTIDTLPEYIQGYLEAIIDAQLTIYGSTIIEDSIRQDILEQIQRYVKLDLGENYFDIYKILLCNMLYTQVSMLEREKALSMLGDRFNLKIYTSSDTSRLTGTKTTFGGYVDYMTEMPKVFKLSKVNINITSKSIKSGIPLRVLDILGAGGFLITNYQPEIAQMFEDGKELVMYESMQDLEDKVRYYLEHEQEREAIAEAGYNKVKQQFSYQIQLGKIMKNVGEK